MRPNVPQKQNRAGRVKTYVELDGEELDVVVHWESTPPEPDVNWPGSFDVTSVRCEVRGEVLDSLLDEEFDSLRDRVMELVR